MKIRKILFVALLAVSLSCNFVSRALLPATRVPVATATILAPTRTPAHTRSPVPTLEASVTPPPAANLENIYVPDACLGEPIATLPPATEQALPTEGLPPNPIVSTAQQLNLFDSVVGRINKVYLYKDFNGVDWKGITAATRAKIKAGLDTETFYQEMSVLVTELKDDHSSFLSPSVSASMDAMEAGHTDYVGIGVLTVGDQVKKRSLVLSIFPGSPAEHAGIKVHDSILAIDGIPVFLNDQYSIGRSKGPQCSAVTMTVQTPGQEPRKMTMLRFRITAALPVDARLVNTSDGSRIGYIFLSTFIDETLPEQVRLALEDFGKLDGLILDNRMNGGGSTNVVAPILGYFTSGVVGNFVDHSDRQPLTIDADPIHNSQTVPLVVLVGTKSASFGEIFSGILQDIGRAKVVGQTTLGNVEILQQYGFDDGSRIWIAAETFDPLVSHANWEKTGIIPDVQAFADWDTFTFETDPAIAASLKLFGHK